MSKRKLVVEVNSRQLVSKDQFQTGTEGVFMVTPPLDENFWIMRVKLSKKQAIVCFPKFGVIGCGFQHEGDDWNTNLPIGRQVTPEAMYEHIKCNKGDDSISKEDCIAAIRLLEKAVRDLEK